MIRLLRRSFLWFLMLTGFWLGGLFWFAAKIAESPPLPESSDVIVVLTGGKNRLEYGLTLLAQGRAKRLFISGVHENITEQQLIDLMSPDLRKKILKLGDDAVTIGREAWNTIGNAEETKDWLKDSGAASMLLVTSNYHMPRSLYEFQHLVKGMDIRPAPVPADDYAATSWFSGSYRYLVFSEYHKYLASKMRNLLLRSFRSNT